MAVNLNNVATKVMKFMQGSGLSLKMFDDSNGKSVSDPAKARYFYVGEPNMMVHIDDSAKELQFHVGEDVDIDKTEVSSMMKNLRHIAHNNMLDFDVRSFGKRIKPKNYAYKIEQNKEQTMSDVFNEGMSPLEGSSRTSRQTLENVRLIVKHRNAVNEETRGARSRNISSIFVENSEGERFKYPFKHLNGARAMARHVASGGVPSDMVGEAIVGLSSNLAKLKEFMSVVSKQKLVNENNRSVVLNVKRNMESIKESIKRIQGANGYSAFVESMALNEEKVIEEASEDTINSYVQKFTKSTFEESLKDIMPLIHRVNEEELENNRANQIERVKEIILAKDKKTGEKKNKIYFPKDPNAEYNYDKIKNQYAEPRNAEEARLKKINMIAMSFDDIGDRVDVDTIDDKKRKNKGHDRAAELSMFLHDVAEEIRKNPAGLNKEKLTLASHLLKMSKAKAESVEETANDRIDEMVEDAFSKFVII